MPARQAPVISATVLGIVLVALLGGVAAFRSNLETQRDVDEILHRTTVQAMRDGAGYYDAMDGALVAKQGVGPSSVLIIRPPAAFLLWRAFPVDVLPWAGLAVLLASGVLSVLLARAGPPWAPAATGGLSGFWIVHFAPHLYLHSEVWAAPLVLGALLAARRDRQAVAAGLALAAVLIRELAVILLLTGLVLALLDRRGRRWWVGAAGLAAGYYGVHLALARPYVDPAGTQPGYGIESVSAFLFAVSPGSEPVASLIGVGALLLGLVGLGVAWRTADAAARLVAPTVVLLVPLSIWSGRNYWTASWAFVLAAFVPIGLVALVPRLTGGGRGAPVRRAP